MKGYNQLGGLLGGLMAEGYPGGPGLPIYGPRGKNRLDMTGWTQPPQGFQLPPGNMPPPVNYMGNPGAGMQMGGLKAYGDGPPPVPGGPITAPPGGGGMPPGPPGGGMPPGGPGSPSAPPSGPGGLPAGTTRPMANQPYGPPPSPQPGQIGWGVGTNNYIPQMSPAAMNYIQQQMYGISSSGLPLGTYGGNPAPWAGQVDPNNYLASIGQLSGNPFGG